MKMNQAEECGFWPLPAGEVLYGALHRPEGPSQARGVVLLLPLGRERLRVYRESANLARHLAQLGYPVFRFDYRGEGESSGEFKRSTLASRQEDTRQAVALLQRETQVESVALVGMRVGALVALQAGVEGVSDLLVLWDPETKPKVFGRNMVRTNVVQQSHYFGQILRNEEELRAALGAGGTISAFGFRLGETLVNELESLDPMALLRRYSGGAVLLFSAPRQAKKPRPDLARWQQAILDAGGRAEVRCCVLNFSWTSRKQWQPSLDPLNEAVVRALEEAP